jgi:peptidoglycan/LPS O-acetylase OafA/YrhL
VLWCFNQLHGYAEAPLWRTVWVDVEALVWAAVVITYVGAARFVGGRASACLAWLGERSYGMYLLHMPLIYLLCQRGWGVSLGAGPFIDAAVTALVVVLPASVLLATLSFAAVEQPFLSLRRRYVGPDSETGAAPVPPAVSRAAADALPRPRLTEHPVKHPSPVPTTAGRSLG